MKKIILTILIVLIFSAAIVFAQENFCGKSTYYSCSSNSNCSIISCVDHVCGGVGEQKTSIEMSCLGKSCYNETKYGLSCQCVNNQCQWAYKDGKPFASQSPIVSMLKGIFNFLISFNPIILLILGIILVVVAKMARIVGIVLIIFALIQLLLLFFH